jgi:hypothetical protein
LEANYKVMITHVGVLNIYVHGLKGEHGNKCGGRGNQAVIEWGGGTHERLVLSPYSPCSYKGDGGDYPPL